MVVTLTWRILPWGFRLIAMIFASAPTENSRIFWRQSPQGRAKPLAACRATAKVLSLKTPVLIMSLMASISACVVSVKSIVSMLQPTWMRFFASRSAAPHL